MSKLFYNRPAETWTEALPIGNGRLGMMIFGTAPREHIQLNEESVWYGGPLNRINPDAGPNFKKVQGLILEGKIEEAERLLKYAFTGTPQSERPYQTLGDFDYEFNLSEKEIEYVSRELDLEKALHKSVFICEGVEYQTTAFAAADEMLVIHICADKPGAISLSGLLTRGRFYNQAGKAAEDAIYIDGTLGDKDYGFYTSVRAIACGGKVSAVGEHILVDKADSVTLYLDGATNFPYHREHTDNPKQYVDSKLSGLTADSYEKILQTHMKEYQKLFGRVKLEIAYDAKLDKLNLEERLKRVKAGEKDCGLVNLYFDYGRYLLISSSRPGNLPANLQGIWNEKLEPTWDSKYTININTEMNYWPADICNLSECQEPLFDLLERMMENGRKTAKEMYGCRGFVAHHNTDIWADTAPQDMAITATYWVMGAAWICTHIWSHYSYSQDEKFLKKMFPVLKECVQFFVDFLIEEEGEFVTCPSVSPENTYIMENGKHGHVCTGSTMDNSILKDLFKQYLMSAEILGDDEILQKEVSYALSKLPPFQVGKYGQIMEWRKDYEEMEVGHRHFSHLYGLFPSSLINEYENPQLVEACEKSLERRMSHGGGHTGWSCAWLINLYARLHKGEKASAYLKYLLTKLSAPNLFDLHPPLEHYPEIKTVFQIDGNFGGTCGIAQMLLQSHLGEIHILPALPKEWSEGKVDGLCAENGFIVSIEWREGKYYRAELLSKAGRMAAIRSEVPLMVWCEGEVVETMKDSKGRIQFPTQRNRRYAFSPYWF